MIIEDTKSIKGREKFTCIQLVSDLMPPPPTGPAGEAIVG